MKTENPGASAKAIQHHYDISNDFYTLWLDKTLTYSCAMWEETQGYDALETAQIRKMDYHIAQARAREARKVLDVGCGWGSVLKRLTEVYGCKSAVGLTLSEAQARWIGSMNLPSVEARLEGWSDHNPTEFYDAIISIGAFEHFARPQNSVEPKIVGYRSFFSRCHRWLKPGGRLSLQTIAFGNMRPEDYNKFIAEKVFPESELPRFSEIAEAAERIFEIVTIRNDRLDYALTCRAWLKRLEANRAAAVKIVGEEVVSNYERFFSYCILSFETGKLDLLRITLRRIDHPRK